MLNLIISFIFLLVPVNDSEKEYSGKVSNVSDFVLENYYYHYDICPLQYHTFIVANGYEDIHHFRIKEIRMNLYYIYDIDTVKYDSSTIKFDNAGRIIQSDYSRKLYLLSEYEVDSNGYVTKRIDRYVNKENSNDIDHTNEIKFIYNDNGLLDKTLINYTHRNIKELCKFYRYENNQLVQVGSSLINNCGKKYKEEAGKSFFGLFTYSYHTYYYAKYDAECRLIFEISPDFWEPGLSESDSYWFGYYYLYHGDRLNTIVPIDGSNIDYEILKKSLIANNFKSYGDTSYVEYYPNGLLKNISTATRYRTEIQLYEYKFYDK